MERYYSALVFIEVLTLFVIIVHLFDNETLSRRVRKEFIIIAILIGICSICEYVGLYLNGSDKIFTTIHGVVKAIEFSIAPIIPALYAKIVVKKKTKKRFRITIIIMLLTNIICEVISIFTPFIFAINEENIYVHSFFYFYYIIMYCLGIIYFVFVLIKYTKKYQSRNIATLSAILLFLICGFAVKAFNSNIYTDWLIVTISLMLFIIYYSDLALKVDALTNLLNRKSYENRINKIDYQTAIIVLDANNFKLINDKYGHQFGDKILKVIAKIIIKAYGKYGYCYRIGGDEFCVVLKRGVLEELVKHQKNNYDRYKIINGLNKEFDDLLAEIYDEYPMLKDGVSKGFGIYYGNNDDYKGVIHSSESIREVIKIADERMYKNKEKMKASNQI